MQISNSSILKVLWLADLFSHWLRIGDGGAEEAVPLQSTVQPGPVVVPVASVRQTPRNYCVELAVHWITGFTLGTSAHATQCSGWRSSVVPVVVSVTARNSNNNERVSQCVEFNILVYSTHFGNESFQPITWLTTLVMTNQIYHTHDKHKKPQHKHKKPQYLNLSNQKNTGLVASYDIQPVNGSGLF